MVASQVSCNQVGFEKSKQDIEQNPSEISNNQTREVMFSSQSNVAETTNKKTHSTTSNNPKKIQLRQMALI